MYRPFGSPGFGGLTAVFVAVIFAMAATTAVAATASYTRSSGASDKDAQPEMLRATGEGAMSRADKEPNRAKAYLKAKTYAKMEAIANLMQSARGTLIRYRAFGSDYSSEEEIEQEIDGVVNSVRIVSERKRRLGKDTIVQVTVEAPAPHLLNPAAASSELPKDAVQLASAAGDRSWTERTANDATPNRTIPVSAKEKPYTSVIIDATGFKVARSMAPKVLRADGSEVWGTLKVDHGFIAEHGIVAYTRSRADAFRNRRAGDNPLVIRACGRGTSKYAGDVVISREDAEYLLTENSRSKFLNAFRVIFITDPSPF